MVCTHQYFIPVGADIIEQHLRGIRADGAPFVAGVYALRQDDTCWFLAADFDKADWKRDVLAYAETARRLGIPVAIEHSRSGNGAHAWLFFEEAVPAALARRFGAYLLTETLDREPDIGLARGTIGAINAHSRSVKSLGNRKRSRLCSLRAIAV
jgi:hypothetical protein